MVGLVVGGAFTLVGPAGAAVSSNDHCAGGPALTTMVINWDGPHESATAGRDSIVRVVTYRSPNWHVSFPRPVHHAGAVCEVSRHRVSKHRVVAKFRTLRARTVEFASVAVRDGSAPADAANLSITR